MEREGQREETLATPGVLEKYQAAGKIANLVLEKVIEKVVVGAKIVDVCDFGDKLIDAELAKVYPKKKLDKGPAFPVCLSINEIVGHFSPLNSEAADLVIKEGDVVKIDLGVQIDGFITLAAHTVVAQTDKTVVVEGKKADVVIAAYQALQAAVRTLKPGYKNIHTTEAISKTFEEFKVNAIEGVLSHDLNKYLIDGNNVILNKETFDAKVEEHEFAVNEVFALDIFVSSGEGKTRETELRTTVYKRALERSYNLKTKHGRAFFHTLSEKFPALCFSTRNFEDEISTKLGVSECLKHELLNGYPVLAEKKGEFVAHFKYTVAIMPKQTLILAGLPLDIAAFKPDNKITDERLIALLDTSITKKK